MIDTSCDIIAAPSLKNINWDFTNSSKSKNIHSIHPYPAKFIPEIPGNVIDIIQPSKAGVVLDPFCGSGVSLVEAQKKGYDSIGIDLNPIACLISKVKTQYINLFELQAVADLVIASAKETQEYSIPNIPNLNHWFKKDAQVGLTKLITAINSLPDSNIREALLLACSSIIVRVSNQDSDTRYAAVEKNIIEANVYGFFAKAVKQLIYAKSREDYSKQAGVSVINGNILTTEAEHIKKDISLLVTSPPYPNAYEYWLYHKYRMWWLGFDPINVKEHEIGARAHFFKKNHHKGEDFSTQMEKLFKNVSPLMMPDAYAVFVVGRSIIHGKEYANHEIIAEAGKKHNFLHVETLTREMNNSRKSFNLTHANIKQEFIVVLQNKKA